MVEGSPSEIYANENGIKTVYYTPSAETDRYEAGRSGDYAYKIERDGTIHITRWYGSDEVLSIPSEMDGLKVSGISGAAFSCSQCVREITIPDGIEVIEEYAFALCTKLEKVTLPESVRRIAGNAFVSCSDTISFIAPEGSYAAEWSGSRRVEDDR